MAKKPSKSTKASKANKPSKKKSSTVKEITQIVAFLLVVAALLTVFVIYPLGASKDMLARADIDEFNPDSMGVNDPTPFVEAGLRVDTFTVEPETVVKLAAVQLRAMPDTMSADPAPAPKGTAILLHDERHDRLSMLPLAEKLIETGFDVILYDQRAVGLSTGEYHTDGLSEAADLGEVVSYLRFRELITHPLVVVGRRVGADAALTAAREDSRIDMVVAIDPYLSTDRWLCVHRAEHDTWWIPFPNTVYWFWYGLRSDFAGEYREAEDIEPVATTTLLLASPELQESDEYATLVERSDPAQLTAAPLPEEAVLDNTLAAAITARLAEGQSDAGEDQPAE